MHYHPFRIALFSILLLGSATAYSHELWFEPEGSGMALHYGDFGQNMRERSPGGNDRWGLQQEQRSAGIATRRRDAAGVDAHCT